MRTKQLQELYDENIRLFVSLSKQRSAYHFPPRKAEARRPPACQLAPLSERVATEGNWRPF